MGSYFGLFTIISAALASLESFFSEAGAFSAHVMDLQIFGHK